MAFPFSYDLQNPQNNQNALAQTQNGGLVKNFFYNTTLEYVCKNI